jgi:flagellar hook-length control protein FliK
LHGNAVVGGPPAGAGSTPAGRPGTRAAHGGGPVGLPDAVAPLSVPTPTTAGQAAAPAAADPARPAVPASPAAQVAAPVIPLRADGDGIHRLTVQLHPADLGPVNVLAELRGGDIHLHLAGATEAGREALRAALPELRRELEQAGFQATSLEVAPDLLRNPDHGRQPGQQAADPQHHTEPAIAEAVPLPAAPPPGAHHLDVRL